MKPALDIVIVTYNTCDLTVQAVETLLDRLGEFDARVVVHDNASSDGTAEALGALGDVVDVERGVDNLGFAAGVNRALARTVAPYVLLLNSDAWPEPDAIHAMLGTLTSSTDIGLVAPLLRAPDGTVEASTAPFPSLIVALALAIPGVVRLRPRWAERHLLPGAWSHDFARDVDWAVGAAWLLRREALEDVGLLDERYFMFSEDIDWCRRARSKGWRVRFEPEATVVHVRNASGSASRPGWRLDCEMSNLYRYLATEHGVGWRCCYRVLSILGCARLIASALVSGRRSEARWWVSVLRRHVKVPDVNGSPGSL